MGKSQIHNSKPVREQKYAKKIRSKNSKIKNIRILHKMKIYVSRIYKCIKENHKSIELIIRIITALSALIKMHINTIELMIKIIGAFIALLGFIFGIIKYHENKLLEQNLIDINRMSLKEQKELKYTIDYYNIELYNNNKKVDELIDSLDIVRYSARNTTLRKRVDNIINIAEAKTMYGKVISEYGDPLTDVKISIIGGSQVYSNSNGEFLIYCRLGSIIHFEKDKLKPLEFQVNNNHFVSYQTIRMIK